MTHIGSNSDDLIKPITNHSEIDLIKSSDDFIYDKFESLQYLSLQNHKNSNATAIYTDELNYNYKFTKQLIKNNYFVFYFGEPKKSINRIKNKGYTEKNALLYYIFRLQGMYEYIVRTKGIISTWKNKNLPALSKYLNLKDEIKNINVEESTNETSVSYKTELFAEDVFNKFMYKIHQESLALK